MRAAPKIGSLVGYSDDVTRPTSKVLGLVVPDPPQYKRPKTIFVEEQTVYVMWNNYHTPVSEWVHELEVLGEAK